VLILAGSGLAGCRRDSGPFCRDHDGNLAGVTMYPSDYGRAAALGIGLFAVMFLTLSL
jgi:hypothetical protein